jgi:hypothetical protein
LQSQQDTSTTVVCERACDFLLATKHNGRWTAADELSYSLTRPVAATKESVTESGFANLDRLND